MDTDWIAWTGAVGSALVMLAGATRDRWLPWLGDKLRKRTPDLVEVEPMRTAHRTGHVLGHRCAACIANPDVHANGVIGIPQEWS